LADQCVDQCHLPGLGVGGGIASQCAAQGGRQAHRFSEIAQTAGALHVGQGLGLFGEGDSVAELAVEGVVDQIDVGEGPCDLPHRALGTVGADIAAQVGNLVAVSQAGGVFRFGDVDAGDAQGFKGEQLAVLADAVAVEVAPDA
jgi:hypothetical protein